MCGKRCCLTLILLLFCAAVAHSQERSAGNAYTRTDGDFISADTLENCIRIHRQCRDIEIHFKWDKYNLELDYMGNRASLERFDHKLDSIGLARIDSIVVVSQSSPEGVYEHNVKLSKNRANTIRKHILSAYPVLNQRLKVYPDGESWLRLREYVKRDTLMKQSTIEKVISIIDSDVNVGTKKWRLEQLPVYGYLLSTYYPRIRNSVFCIVYYSEVVPIKLEAVGGADIRVESFPLEPQIEISPVVPPLEGWSPRLYLKTNTIGLGLAIANLGVEVDLAKHWSVSLPVYYSAWNYFKTTIKFRTFATQPELRYWHSEYNDGFFAGVHFGIASYNFAFDGAYRYQDHYRQTPAVGGGVNVGYRLPISKNRRWRVEFSLGAGVYSNHYDIFHNTPCTKDGLMIESIKTTYWGIDQAAVSLSYSFDLNRRGGAR